MKIEYPAWFYAHYKPHYKPSPPPETIFIYKEVSRMILHDWSHEDLTILPEGANSITVQVEKDYYDESVTGVVLIFCHKEEVPNPKYDEQLKIYENALANFKDQLKQWRKWKRVWDKEQKEKEQAKKLKTYKKLRKEFENG